MAFSAKMERRESESDSNFEICGEKPSAVLPPVAVAVSCVCCKRKAGCIVASFSIKISKGKTEFS